MADDDKNTPADPAPLPRHERAWRHPSEVGQQRRALSRRPAPPLSPLVASLCGVLGLAIIIAIVALIVPPSAKRETVRMVRNAATANPRPTQVVRAPQGLLTADNSRFVLRIEDPSGNGQFFATTGNPAGVVVDDDGRLVPLTVVTRADGVTLLRGDVSTARVASIDGDAFDPPEIGTEVYVTGRNVVSAVVGISVNADVHSFIPLAGDILTTDVAESSVVEDAAGRILGLYTERDDSRGYVPISVIKDLLMRS